DDTSEKVVHESSSTSDSERTESDTESGSDPEKAHVAQAGPHPEPMQEDQTGLNSGKLHVSLAGPNPEHMAKGDGTFMKRRPEECYDLIENITAYHNDWDTSTQRSESSGSITSSFDPEIVALKDEMAEINKNLMKVLQINQQVKAVTPSC
ncbi:hypothetical protein Tco_0690263, partial [Tanacetum coccineum]